MNLKKSTFIITIILFILSINNNELKDGRFYKTNINTQVNTIAEVYNYTLMLNSNIFLNKNFNKIDLVNINNDLLFKSKSYKSKYSYLSYKPSVKIIKDEKVLLGFFDFTFNENLHLVNIKEEGYKKDRKIFNCIIKVYLIDYYLYNHFPECNYQNLLSFNDNFNFKVKEVIILTYLNNIAYRDSNFFSEDSDIFYIYNKLYDFKFSKFYPKFSYNVTAFVDNKNISDKLTFENNNSIYSNNLSLLVVDVKLPIEPANDKYETCRVRYFYPNTELTPGFLHGEVASCNNTEMVS